MILAEKGGGHGDHAGGLHDFFFEFFLDSLFLSLLKHFIAFGFGDEAGVNGDGKFDKVEHTGEVNRLVKMHCMKTPETKGEEEEEEE